MKTFKELMTEASVGKDNVHNASQKIVDYISKNIGVKYNFVDYQMFTNNSGTFGGSLYVSPEDSSALRVNWEGTTFHSINLWDNYMEDAKPTMEIFVKKYGPSDRSFVKVLPEICAEILGENGGEKDSEEAMDEATHYNYVYNGKEFSGREALIKFMYDSGESLESMAEASGQDASYVRSVVNKYLKSKGTSVSASGLVSSNPGQAEIVQPSKYTAKANKMLQETEYADPDKVFEELDSYLSLVMRGYLPALMITGQGGIGKSYNVNQAIKKFGKQRHDDYEIVKGRSSAAALYKTLWYNRDKIIVFDDCDSIFDTADGMNVLKGALDSGEVREISWLTKADGMVSTTECNTNEEVLAKVQEWEQTDGKGKEGTPNHFFFEGQVIFISNLTRNDIYKKDRALLSRCTYVDIVLTATDVIKRIGTVLPHIKIYKAFSKGESKDITNAEMKQEVYDYISSDEFTKNPKLRGKEINFRLFSQIYLYRHAELPNWKELAFRAGG